MVIEPATGIILRTRLLTETSLIVQWLTPTLGRLSTVAKGARRANSPFAGKLDLFYLADFTFHRSRRSELHTLRELSLQETHGFLRTELRYLQQAAYCAALINLATEPETPLPEAFELLRTFLQQLPQTPPRPETVFAFELRFLEHLGFGPLQEPRGLSPGARECARVLATGAMAAQLQLSPAQQSELRQFLHGFIIYHLGRLPPGRPAAVA